MALLWKEVIWKNYFFQDSIQKSDGVERSNSEFKEILALIFVFSFSFNKNILSFSISSADKQTRGGSLPAIYRKLLHFLHRYCQCSKDMATVCLSLSLSLSVCLCLSVFCVCLYFSVCLCLCLFLWLCLWRCFCFCFCLCLIFVKIFTFFLRQCLLEYIFLN